MKGNQQVKIPIAKWDKSGRAVGSDKTGHSRVSCTRILYLTHHLKQRMRQMPLLTNTLRRQTPISIQLNVSNIQTSGCDLFPGGPVVKTPHFHHKKCRFILSLETKIPNAEWPRLKSQVDVCLSCFYVWSHSWLAPFSIHSKNYTIKNFAYTVNNRVSNRQLQTLEILKRKEEKTRLVFIFPENGNPLTPVRACSFIFCMIARVLELDYLFSSPKVTRQKSLHLPCFKS